MKRLIFILMLMSASNLACAQLNTLKLKGHVGVGVGTIRDKLSPHLDALGYVQQEDDNAMFQYGLWLKTTYSYNDDVKNINSFLSMFLLKEVNDNTYGLGVGYAIKRNGGVFDKHAILISYYYKVISSGLYISPEIILNNGFSEPIPSLRIGVLL